MAKHRVALIGLGMAVTAHAKSLLDLRDRVEVAAAYSPTERRRSEFASRFPFPTSDDLDAVIADPSIDAALVLTPPRTHLPLVERLAAAGKHVLLEKPVEADTPRAEATVEACARAGVALGVVFQQRFRPAARFVAHKIHNGELGEVAAASVSARWWRPQSYYDEPGRGTIERDGGGVLMTQAIHILDLFLTLTPPVVEVAAFAGTSLVHRMETEDIAVGALRFANGALGSIDASTASYPGFPERIEIVGTLGTAIYVRGKGRHLLSRRTHGDGGRRTAGRTGSGADGRAQRRASRAALRISRRAGRRPITGQQRSGCAAVHYVIDALLASSRNSPGTAVRAPTLAGQ